MRFKPFVLTGTAVAALVLAGCGGSDTTDDTADPKPSESVTESASPEAVILTQEQADLAVLTDANMGDGFTSAPSEEDTDDSDEDLGCLNALQDVKELEEETRAGTEFTSTSDTGTPSIENVVYSYATAEEISATFQVVTDALADCDSIDVTSADGTQIALDVTVDSDATSPSAEEQINIAAIGTLTAPDFDTPFGIYLSAARIGNNLSSMFLSTIPDESVDTQTLYDAYVAAATERMAAVIAGETPSDAPVS